MIELVTVLNFSDMRRSKDLSVKPSGLPLLADINTMGSLGLVFADHVSPTSSFLYVTRSGKFSCWVDRILIEVVAMASIEKHLETS